MTEPAAVRPSRTAEIDADDVLLSATSYALLGVVIAITLVVIDEPLARAAVLALQLAFGALMLRAPGEGSPPRAHGYLATQSALVVLTLLIVRSVGRGPSFFMFLFFVLSVQAMLFLPTRSGLAWVLGFALIMTVFYVQAEGWRIGLLAAAGNGAGFLFFGAFGRALVRAEAAHAESRRLLAELEAAHDQLKSYAARVEDLAVSEERNRLARDLHDTLGHRLTVAVVQLEGAARLLEAEPDRAAGMVDTVRDQLRHGLDELRRTVAALREPLVLDASLPRALYALADDFADATGIAVDVRVPDEIRVSGEKTTADALPEPHRLALYRAAQEGLTNVGRHADATTVRLSLALQADAVLLTVTDDGQGPPPGIRAAEGTPGFGLRGLRERAARLGGTVTLDAAPTGGARLAVRLPLSDVRDGAVG